jgi:hypothetical protein
MPRPTLRDVHAQNAALTNISIAYRNANYIYRSVFPTVGVDKKSDFYYIFNKAAWFRNRSGLRAPGTSAPRAGYSLSSASYLCINDSFATEVHDEVRANADQPLRPNITAVNFVSDALELGAEIRVADAVTGSANWQYAASPTTQWSSDTSDPWGDIDAGINGVVSSIGRMPNVAAMSWDVFRHLRQHPDLLDRVKYTRPTGRIEITDLAQWFGFDRVLIGMALKDMSLEGQSASMSYVWGDGFWMGYVTANAALEEPSAGYTLVWNEVNRPINIYRQDVEHKDIVESEWFTDEIITASDAGAIIYNAI